MQYSIAYNTIATNAVEAFNLVIKEPVMNFNARNFITNQVDQQLSPGMRHAVNEFCPSWKEFDQRVESVIRKGLDEVTELLQQAETGFLQAAEWVFVAGVEARKQWDRVEPYVTLACDTLIGVGLMALDALDLYVDSCMSNTQYAEPIGPVKFHLSNADIEWAVETFQHMTFIVDTLEEVDELATQALEPSPTVDYNSYGVAELRKLATERGIQWKNTHGKNKHMKKAEMIDALS